MNPEDHDLLIALNQKFDNLIDKLNGHVPERCIAHNERLGVIEKNFERHESGHVSGSRFNITTLISVIAILIAAASTVIGILH